MSSPSEEPRFSPRAFRWFAIYLDRYLRRRFAAVRVAADGLPQLPADRPAIVYSNHPSWWDPMLYMLLAARLLPGREGYGPMDAEMLERYGVLRRFGVFPVEQGTRRGAAQFLRASRTVLARPGAMLWLTAEGRFRDPRERPVRLLPGVAHLVDVAPDALLVPLALEYPFWNESAPEALARFGAPLPAGDPSLAGVDVEARTLLLATRLERTQDELADAACRRDPSAFRTLTAGRTGIGGVYDAWRRGRALLRGESFDASHEGRR